MPLGHVSAEICHTLRSFWKGNCYGLCTGPTTTDAPVISDNSHKSQNSQAASPTFPFQCVTTLKTLVLIPDSTSGS